MNFDPSGFFSRDTIGPILISTCVSFMWFGVVTREASAYYSNFPTDRWAFKAIGGFCLLLATVDTAASGIWCCRYLVSYVLCSISERWSASVLFHSDRKQVTGSGNPLIVSRAYFEVVTGLVCLGLAGTTVSNFYAWRIYKISTSNGRLSGVGIIIPVWLLVCSCTQLGTSVLVVILFLQHPVWEELTIRLFPGAWVWLFSSIAGDLTITSTMFYHLHIKAKGIKTSQTIFQKIIYRSVQANACALVCQVYSVATFKLPQAGFWWGLGIFSLTKVLNLSLFSSFNARRPPPAIIRNDSNKPWAHSVRGQEHRTGDLDSTPGMEGTHWSTRPLALPSATEAKLSCITVKSETRVLAQLDPQGLGESPFSPTSSRGASVKFEVPH